MSAADGLRAQVLARRRRWLAARGVEALLVAGGVAALTLAAQRLSGPAELAPAALAAGLCGALAAALLARERWRDEARFARRLDARLGADGALATACDLARRGARDGLAELLAARTAAALERSRWRGAAAPPSPLFLAALLGGLALLAAVGAPRVAAPGLEAALGELEALAADADPAQVAAAVERLEAALAAAAPTPARAREAARRRDGALERLAAGRGGEAGRGAPAAAGAGASGAAQGAGGPAGEGSGRPTLAAGAGDRTMSRPDGPPPMDRESRTPPNAPAGAAPTRAATWPRRHDAVVAGYLERRARD